MATDTKREGSTEAAVEAAKAIGAPVGETFRPGSEPAQKYVEPPQGENVNPFSTVPHAADFGPDKILEALVALASDDQGAARRVLFGDADVGIHGREPSEVANPTTDLADIPKGAKKQIERHKEINRERAADKSSVSPTGPPPKDEDNLDHGAPPEEPKDTKSK